jgi:AraC family transcriptional regulator
MPEQRLPVFNQPSTGTCIAEKTVSSTVILSSIEQNWKGVDVVQFRHSFSELGEAEPFPNHILTINLGSQVNGLAKIGEKAYEGLLNNTGALSIIPANLPTEWYYKQSQEINVLHIYLKPTFLYDLAVSSDINLERIEILSTCGNFDSQIKHIGLVLKAELESGCPSGRLFAESLATALGIHLIKQYSTSTQTLREYEGGLPKHRLRQAIDYINDNLEQDIKLANIADVVGMSQYYFCQLFKQSMGIAPYQYVIQQRVERAKQLLQQTEVTISDIALECGFANQSHFTKHFRKLTGITPKAYRER